MVLFRIIASSSLFRAWMWCTSACESVCALSICSAACPHSPTVIPFESYIVEICVWVLLDPNCAWLMCVSAWVNVSVCACACACRALSTALCVECFTIFHRARCYLQFSKFVLLRPLPQFFFSSTLFQHSICVSVVLFILRMPLFIRLLTSLQYTVFKLFLFFFFCILYANLFFLFFSVRYDTICNAWDAYVTRVYKILIFFCHCCCCCCCSCLDMPLLRSFVFVFSLSRCAVAAPCLSRSLSPISAHIQHTLQTHTRSKFVVSFKFIFAKTWKFEWCVHYCIFKTPVQKESLPCGITQLTILRLRWFHLYTCVRLISEKHRFLAENKEIYMLQFMKKKNIESGSETTTETFTSSTSSNHTLYIDWQHVEKKHNLCVRLPPGSQ